MSKILIYKNAEKIIKKFKIANLKLLYDGAHNKTYTGLFGNEVVQVRIAKNNIVNHNNELKFHNSKKEIIYIDKFLMIKKWINGHELKSNDLETLIKIKNVLIKHWILKIRGINLFIFDDNEYYGDNEIVLSHGDLRNKNIIIDNEKNVHLIDFEWVTYTSKYFDLAHLHLYCLFQINDIVDVFNVDKTKLELAIASVAYFNSKWEENISKR